MPRLSDPRDEEYCRCRTRGMNQSASYRRAFDTQALPTSIWTMAYKKEDEVADRLAELRAEIAKRSDIPGIIKAVELKQRLSRVITTPIDEISSDPDNGDLIQERKTESTTNPKTGEVTVYETVKAMPRLGAIQQLCAMEGHNVQAPQQLHLHQHNSTTLNLNTDSALADLMGELSALPEPRVVEMKASTVFEPVPEGYSATGDKATMGVSKAKRGRKLG